jgi:O-antigen ligase
MAHDSNTFSPARNSWTPLGLESWRAGLLPVAVMAVACALGWTITQEKWLFVGAALALLLLLVWPLEAALGLYAFLIPFETMTATGSGSGPSTTLLRYVGLVALVVVPGVGWLRERMVKPPRAAMYWSLFVLWCAITTMWAIDQDNAWHRMPTAVGLWLLYLGVVSVQVTTKELSRITLLTILGGCSAALFSSYMFVSSGGALGRASIPEGSTLADPDFFAATLLLPFSLAFGEVLSNRGWTRRVLYLAAMGVMALAVFLSMSRGMLVAIAVITGVFLYRLRLNWRLLFPVAVLGAALLFMPAAFFARVQEGASNRLTGRVDIWVAGLHSLLRYGLFGAGMENFSNAYQEYSGTARFYLGQKRASHNIYLQSSVEFGILGILALIAAVRSHLREFSRPVRTCLAPARVIALEAACWGMLVAGSVQDMLWRKAFWFVWALPVIAIHVRHEDKPLLEAERIE